jgi:hypothetical protein
MINELGAFLMSKCIVASLHNIMKKPSNAYICIEESIVNAPRITDHGSVFKNLTSLFVLFVFLLCRLTSGAFTIDSSTSTLRIDLNEHPIYLYLHLKMTLNVRICENYKYIFFQIIIYIFRFEEDGWMSKKVKQKAQLLFLIISAMPYCTVLYCTDALIGSNHHFRLL